MTFSHGGHQNRDEIERESDETLEDLNFEINLKNERSGDHQIISQTRVPWDVVKDDCDVFRAQKTVSKKDCPTSDVRPQHILSLEPLQKQEVRSSSLTENQSTSSPVNVFACNVCSYKIEKLFNFRLHMAQHSADSETLIPVDTGHYKLRCGICGYFGTDEQDLSQHVEDHAFQKRFLCGYSDLDFQKKKEVRQHIWKTHKKVKLFYDRQILYKLMARQPHMMVRMFPKVLIDMNEVDEYLSNHRSSN
ncbi:hypothetical protein Btru_037516 [Bulinus truncatus]|nr:hypothetical protein Btru_037516 [Bulinus truncatus]